MGLPKPAERGALLGPGPRCTKYLHGQPWAGRPLGYVCPGPPGGLASSELGEEAVMQSKALLRKIAVRTLVSQL